MSLVLCSLLGGIVVVWFVARHLHLGGLFSAVLAGVVAACLFILFNASFFARDPFSALSAVLLLMPFHTIVDNVVNMLVDSDLVRLAFSSWKELALLSILVVVLVQRVADRRATFTLSLELVLATLFALWGAAFIFSADSLRIGVLEYRNIYEGMLVLLVVYAIRPPLVRVFKLLDWMVAQGAILSMWGIVSGYLLDFYSYLRTFGFISAETSRETVRYQSVFGRGKEFIRANSIFTGSNEFGFYLATLVVPLMVLLLFERDQPGRSRQRWYIWALLLMIVGQLISQSRSAWILIAVGLIVIYPHIRGSRHKIRVALVVGLLLVVTFAAVPDLWYFVMNTVRLEESGAAGRVGLLREGLATIMANPMGIGLGNASYKFFGATTRYTHTESYVFVIALELGWMGLLLYLLMMAAFVRKCYHFRSSRYPFDRRLSALIGMALLLGTLASQSTSAIPLDWLFQIYLWFFVAAALWGTAPEASESILQVDG